jgi:hypothetical protein
MAANHNEILDSKNGFLFSFNQETGDWLWKALPVKKQPHSGREKPFFKISEDIENTYHQLYDKALVNGVKNIARYLNGAG